jgi:tetratricopeptide (TPR) repeat protein
MHAARAVLPLLLPAAREQDFPLFGTVAPKALAEFFLGEQQYRQAAFEQALGHYRRAVRADSGFGLAALHGAQAATWTSQPDQARALLAVALARPAGLPPRLRGLAEGLDDYLHGRADSAVARFRRVVQVDQENSEAWMLLGETYTHLLPSAGPLDSLAEDAFQRTHRLDSAFTPVLFHLIEAAARRGDTVAGGHALRALRAARPDSIELGSAELMLRCVTRPLMAPDWRQAVLRSPDEVRVAAQSLSVAGLEQQQCARDAWRALVTFDARTPDPTTIRRRFAALLGLQNVLIAEGKDEEVRALWASDTLFNRGFGAQMMVLDALATGRFQPFADSFATARFTELAAGDTVVSPELWLAGSWAARSGSADAARAAAESLAERARVDGERVDSLLARSLAAQLSLARGDSVGALAMLGALQPNAPETSLIAWRPLESLGYERLLLTELLVRRRRFPEALKLAANFDAPAPLVYAVFLPASLSLRREAAEAWGEQAVARRSAKRLQELGQGRVQ